jgi:hypothetical protein
MVEEVRGAFAANHKASQREISSLRKRSAIFLVRQTPAKMESLAEHMVAGAIGSPTPVVTTPQPNLSEEPPAPGKRPKA